MSLKCPWPFARFANGHDRGAQGQRRSRVDVKDAARRRGYGVQLVRVDREVMSAARPIIAVMLGSPKARQQPFR